MKTIGSGFILHAKPHGETAAIVTLFSEEIGKIRGLVRGGRKNRAELQTGNLGQFTWQRRLEHQLGTLTWENTHSTAATYLDTPTALAALQYISEVLQTALPEEHAYPNLHIKTKELLNNLKVKDLPTKLAWWELTLLTTIGYGLSLTKETAVPCEEGTALAYVSPNTGRAVSQKMGEPYKEKLLPLPYMFGGLEQEKQRDIATAFQLTGFFINRAMHGKKLESRNFLLTQLSNQMRS